MKTYSLAKGKIWSGTCIELRLSSGVVWLTSEGHVEDWILSAGEFVSTQELEHIVIEALTDAVFEATDQSASVPSKTPYGLVRRSLFRPKGTEEKRRSSGF